MNYSLSRIHFAEGNRSNHNFPRVAIVVSGLRGTDGGSGKYTYISFLPLFFMEINRTLPRSRHVACAMRPSHFEAIPEVTLLMTSWGWLLFDETSVPSFSWNFSSLSPLPPHCNRWKMFQFRLVQSPLSFTGGKKKKKREIRGPDKSDLEPVKYSLYSFCRKKYWYQYTKRVGKNEQEDE